VLVYQPMKRLCLASVFLHIHKSVHTPRSINNQRMRELSRSQQRLMEVHSYIECHECSEYNLRRFRGVISSANTIFTSEKVKIDTYLKSLDALISIFLLCDNIHVCLRHRLLTGKSSCYPSELYGFTSQNIPALGVSS
jgi:hypothetical protein